MTNKLEEKLTLGLETGIDGGSVAVLKGNRLLCSAEGAGDISKSEDLLSLVDNLLKKNSLLKEDIGYIAVSDSPGSLTGLRIGLATAAGLKDSIAAEIYKIPILEAQVIISPAKNNAISALYTEKGGLYYCKFRYIDGIFYAETDIMNEREPNEFVEKLFRENTTLVLDNNLAAKLSNIGRINFEVMKNDTYIIGGNLAGNIGLAANLIMRPIMK